MMYGYVAIAILLVAAVAHAGRAAPPVRVTIHCGSDERDSYNRPRHRAKPSNLHSDFDVDSFCNFIHGAIPKEVKNGRFILKEPDQTGYGDTLTLMSAPAPAAAPPERFIPRFALPRFKAPKLQVPIINVPKLRVQSDHRYSAPRLGSSPFSASPSPRSPQHGADSSAERMEIFKKGLRKMLHVVKVLAQIDRYLSERTRIVIDKLAKTFAD